MVLQQRLYTIEEFEGFLAQPENKNRLFELINGEIVEKMPTEEHGLATTNIATSLNIYAHQTKLGRVGVEVRHRIPEDRHNSILPDVSFTMAKQPVVKEGSVPRMPDVAVEVKSPDDTYNEMRDKAKYYLTNGSRMVILVFPEKRFVEVHAPNVDVEILFEHETISGREVLPGFTLAVRDIFKDPLHPYTQLLIGSLPTLQSKEMFKGIPGLTPSLLSPPPGCMFHHRCPQVMAHCAVQVPPLVEIKPERWVACHLYEEGIRK